jgi:hypothetical protein
MLKKLPFDTLELATLLKAGGVENSEVHAASLAAVITQNLYVKDEVDKMIEAALARFDESMRQSNVKFEATLAKFDVSLNEFKLALERQDARHEKTMLELENRMEKAINRNLYTIITVLGGLIAFANTATALLHYFIH